MTRLEMLMELRDLFEDCVVQTNDRNWADYDTDPDSVLDYRCVMARLERMIRDEEQKEDQQRK